MTVKAEAGLPVWLTCANPITDEYHYFHMECPGKTKQQFSVNEFFALPSAGIELELL